MTIVVFGSTNVDVTAYSPRLPRPGETVHGDSYSIGLGGKGANQAVAVARLGGHVELAGRTGVDTFGTLARQRLAHFGVATSHLYADPDHLTGIAVIGVDAQAENCITVIGGANMAVDHTDVARQAALLAEAKVLLLQLEVPLDSALEAARQVRAGGGLVILDPAPAPAEPLPEAVWQTVDCMTPNETETEALVGIRPTDIASAARAAAAMTDRGLPIALVKMGAGGVYWRSAAGEGHVPVFPVKAIDTVAAGDCFNGGLAYALARGDALPDAVRFASACGGLATTRRGASDAAPLLAEVEALMAAGAG
ncbi:ribokinase [Caenispirillum bisanense]|uniref:ribokinase n=1 Tax=Caenispirillum bisanense TaxID=414052 RepID=UPI0031DE8D84